MHTVPSPDPHLPAALAEARPRSRGFFARLLLHALLLGVAAAAFVAYQHFKLHDQPTAATVSLVAAGLFAFSPVRALIGEFFAIEGKALHFAHGLGGLAFMGLGATGVISGTSMLNHAAMAPFAIMGAAQALMHADHPRNAQQAAAIRQFATSLPEVAQFTQTKDLTSPANAARAVAVLSDLIGKAEALGETELRADPQFQGALAQATTRTGLTLGMDSIDKALDRLAENPQTAAAVPQLRARLAQARGIAKAAHHRQ